MDYFFKLLEKFWEKKLIKFPQDIYKLDYKKIESLEGLIETISFKFKIFYR